MKGFLSTTKWYGIVEVAECVFIMLLYIHGSPFICWQHLLVLYQDLTFAACSFHTILNQAMDQLGYHCYYVGSRPTSHGLLSHLHFSLDPIPFASRLVCSIFCRQCAWPCETKECALIDVLMYLYDVRDYNQTYISTVWTMPWHVVGALLLFCSNETIIYNYVCMDFGLYGLHFYIIQYVCIVFVIMMYSLHP